MIDGGKDDQLVKPHKHCAVWLSSGRFLVVCVIFAIQKPCQYRMCIDVTI